MDTSIKLYHDNIAVWNFLSSSLVELSQSFDTCRARCTWCMSECPTISRLSLRYCLCRSPIKGTYIIILPLLPQLYLEKIIYSYNNMIEDNVFYDIVIVCFRCYAIIAFDVLFFFILTDRFYENLLNMC